MNGRSLFNMLIVLLLPWIVSIFFYQFGAVDFGILSNGIKIYLAFYILLAVLFSFLGFVVGATFSLDHNVVLVRRYSRSKGLFFSIFFCFLMISFTFLTLYDFFIVKGGDILSIAVIRESDNAAGPRGSLIGLVIALTSASSIFFATILVVYQFKITFFSVALILISVLSLLLSGGRNSIFFVFIYAVVFFGFFYRFFLFRFARLRFYSIVFATLSVCLLIYSAYIFIDRYSAVGLTPEAGLNYFSMNYGHDFRYQKIFEQLDLSGMYFIIVWVSFYLSHSLHYFDEYFISGFDSYNQGCYSLSLICRGFSSFIGGDSYVEPSILQEGVYLSLPGFFFVDFGYFGSLSLVAVLAFSYGILYVRRKRLSLASKALFAYVTVWWLFSPFFFVPAIGNGFSFLFCIIVLYLFSLKVYT